MLDFVDPVDTGRCSGRCDRLGGDNEPGWKRFDFPRAKKIGRRGAGHNDVSVVCSFPLQLTRFCKRSEMVGKRSLAGPRDVVQASDHWAKIVPSRKNPK